jgi:hypothetical protein
MNEERDISGRGGEAFHQGHGRRSERARRGPYEEDSPRHSPPDFEREEY